MANQRCTLSIGAWERCCGLPIDWETDLRLRLPAVAFELRDLHGRVCAWAFEAPPLVLAVQSLDPAAFHQAGSSVLYSFKLSPKSMRGICAALGSPVHWCVVAAQTSTSQPK